MLDNVWDMLPLDGCGGGGPLMALEDLCTCCCCDCCCSTVCDGAPVPRTGGNEMPSDRASSG